MEKKDLLQYCRYYKGQNENPYKADDPKFTAWKIEMLYTYCRTEDREVIDTALQDYIQHGMSDFHMEDDIPMTLKAFLMNRFFQYNDREDIDEFKKFYEKLYS